MGVKVCNKIWSVYMNNDDNIWVVYIYIYIYMCIYICIIIVIIIYFIVNNQINILLGFSNWNIIEYGVYNIIVPIAIYYNILCYYILLLFILKSIVNRTFIMTMTIISRYINPSYSYIIYYTLYKYITLTTYFQQYHSLLINIIIYIIYSLSIFSSLNDHPLNSILSS
jgi:hypothetical protein